MVELVFERLEQLWEPLIEATINSPIYVSFGLGIVFLYAMSPNAFFIPNVALWSPLFFQAEDTQKFLVMIIFLTAIAGFLGDSIVYWGARRGMRFFITGFRQKETIKMNHLFHKYHRVIFIISPTIPFLSEAVLIFAAFKKLSYEKFSPFLLLGNFVKNIIEVTIFISIMTGAGII